MPGAVTAPYTEAQKTTAKTVVVMSQGIDLAHAILSEVWAGGPEENPAYPASIPSKRSLENWKKDPRIRVDEAMVAEYGSKERARVIAVSSDLVDDAAEAFKEAKDRYMDNNGSALDVLNLSKAYGILVDKISGRFGNASQAQNPIMGSHGGNIGGNVFNGPVQVFAYGPKELNSAPLAPSLESATIIYGNTNETMSDTISETIEGEYEEVPEGEE